jgi:Lamin Tail Domain
MSSSLTNKQWVIVVLVNIVISAITTLIIVRVLTNQPASQTAGATIPIQQQAIVPVQSTLAPLPTPITLAVQAPLNSPTPKPVATPVAKPSATTSVTASLPAKPSTPTPSTSAAKNVSVTISNVLYPGQRQREVVVIVNLASEVPLKGWTLTSSSNISYTFGNVTLFKDSFISLHTTTGADVTTDLFMNHADAAWQPGDMLTLTNNGLVMATYTVR